MDFSRLVESQRRHHAGGHTRSEESRRRSLEGLLAAIDAHEAAIFDALERDLGKEPVEAFLSEVAFVRGEIRHALRHLRSWMKPSRRKSPLLAWPARAEVVRDPAGVVLILGPWNYPFQLVLGPLVAAVAAGNAAVVKTSELAPATAAAVADLIADAFDPAHVTVVQGGPEVAMALQEQRFDHVFFTGSTATGRKVMAAAARHLTPVTLELGGKCPVLVFPSRDGDLETIARRIAWGKRMNAGQTCVAPDHVWVERRHRDALVKALAAAFEQFGPAGKIINAAHFDRLRGYLGDGRVVHGGEPDAVRRVFPPTILTEVPRDAAVMREEIFGPVLPVLACDGPDEALAAIARAPSPLAVYLFTGDRDLIRRTADATRSGGICVNDVILQITGNELPFGGVGDSGMGRYRGKAGFDTFTRERSILRRTLWPDFPVRYPSARQTLELVKKIPAAFTSR
jgi:aldehyde dehydrogenase (NAD+)